MTTFLCIIIFSCLLYNKRKGMRDICRGNPYTFFHCCLYSFVKQGQVVIHFFKLIYQRCCICSCVQHSYSGISVAQCLWLARQPVLKLNLYTCWQATWGSSALIICSLKGIRNEMANENERKANFLEKGPSTWLFDTLKKRNFKTLQRQKGSPSNSLWLLKKATLEYS